MAAAAQQQEKPKVPVFTEADVQECIREWPWTAAKWAKDTDARHEYVMSMWDEVREWFWPFVKYVRAEGYKAKWTNPVTGKTYSNTYLELGEWTYWWVPRCINREHTSVETLRIPPSAAEAAKLAGQQGKLIP